MKAEPRRKPFVPVGQDTAQKDMPRELVKMKGVLCKVTEAWHSQAGPGTPRSSQLLAKKTQDRDGE